MQQKHNTLRITLRTTHTTTASRIRAWRLRCHCERASSDFLHNDPCYCTL